MYKYDSPSHTINLLAITIHRYLFWSHSVLGPVSQVLYLDTQVVLQGCKPFSCHVRDGGRVLLRETVLCLSSQIHTTGHVLIRTP